MIPTLEDVILGLIAGTVTKDEAWRWIHAHFDQPPPGANLPAVQTRTHAEPSGGSESQPTVSKDGPRSTSERAEPGEINLLLLLLNDVRMMIRHGYEYRDREVLERVERAREHWTGKLLRAAPVDGGGSDTEGSK